MYLVEKSLQVNLSPLCCDFPLTSRFGFASSSADLVPVDISDVEDLRKSALRKYEALLLTLLSSSTISFPEVFCIQSTNYSINLPQPFVFFSLTFPLTSCSAESHCWNSSLVSALTTRDSFASKLLISIAFSRAELLATVVDLLTTNSPRGLQSPLALKYHNRCLLASSKK